MKYLPKKVATKFNKVSCRALLVGDTRNFHNSFFVKNYYLNLKLSLKTKKNQKDESRLKIAWHSTRQMKYVEKRESKTKNDKTQTATNIFFLLLLFHVKKSYVTKHIWKNLVHNATFVLQFFHLAGHWKCSNKRPTPF